MTTCNAHVNTSCLVLDVPDPDCGERGTGEDADPNVLTSATAFATDRRTGSGHHGDEYLPEGTPEREGLLNKFAFDAEKKDYQFWDGILDRAVTVPRSRGRTRSTGLEIYGFYYYGVVEQEEIAMGDVDGTYSLDKTMWIEPKTGAIIDQEQHDVRTCRGRPAARPPPVLHRRAGQGQRGRCAGERVVADLLTKTIRWSASSLAPSASSLHPPAVHHAPQGRGQPRPPGADEDPVAINT